MSRVQLALNVADLEESVAFYTKVFGVQPHKRRPGYVNFEIAEPPLKLVLMEVGASARGEGTAGALNHLGVEVDSTAEVRDAIARLESAGLATRQEQATVCCYAEQDKVWVNDPDGAPWEVYTIKDDDPAAPRDAFDLPLVEARDGEGACCTPASGFAGKAASGASGSACC